MDNLAPCPFCGAEDAVGKDGPFLNETGRTAVRKRNKRGNTIGRVHISHVVECTVCGATGPESYTLLNEPDHEILTDTMIETSAAAAVFAWNARMPIRNRAYELVSRLVADALKKLPESP